MDDKRTKGICVDCEIEAEENGTSAQEVGLVDAELRICRKHYNRRDYRKRKVVRASVVAPIRRLKEWSKLDQAALSLLYEGLVSHEWYKEFRMLIDFVRLDDEMPPVVPVSVRVIERHGSVAICQIRGVFHVGPCCNTLEEAQRYLRSGFFDVSGDSPPQ